MANVIPASAISMAAIATGGVRSAGARPARLTDHIGQCSLLRKRDGVANLRRRPTEHLGTCAGRHSSRGAGFRLAPAFRT
jgi:hypothetical protein